jgi:Na+/H+-dicarboxylate symporter
MFSYLINKIKTDPAAQILFSVFLAAVIFMPIGSSPDLKSLPFIQWLSVDVLDTVGTMLMNALKLMILPLVFLGIMTGISGMRDLNKMKRMATWAIGLYLLTTVIAITQGVTLAVLYEYFIGFSSSISTSGLVAPEVGESTGGIKVMLLSLIPSNIVVAMYNGNMLGLIFFSIISGIAIASSSKDDAEEMNNLAVRLNNVVLRIVTLIMKFAPIGIFGLMGNIFIENGVDQLVPLLAYVGVLFTALMIHLFITYRVLIIIFTGLKTGNFYYKMREIWLFGFSTASSSATIPVTLKTLEKKMGVHPSVSSFTVPLGATINMDGTAIMQGVATIFIAAIYNVDLTLATLATVIFTATTASIGTASVRSAGTIMLTMVLASAGLPAEGVAMILAVDPILDMIRTSVNLTGDAAVSTIVAHKEGQLDHDLYNQKEVVLEEDLKEA